MARCEIHNPFSTQFCIPAHPSGSKSPNFNINQPSTNHLPTLRHSVVPTVCGWDMSKHPSHPHTDIFQTPGRIDGCSRQTCNFCAAEIYGCQAKWLCVPEDPIQDFWSSKWLDILKFNAHTPLHSLMSSGCHSTLLCNFLIYGATAHC